MSSKRLGEQKSPKAREEGFTKCHETDGINININKPKSSKKMDPKAEGKSER